MSNAPVPSFEEILLKKLKIHTDEPVPDSNYFNAKTFSSKLSSFLKDPNLPTPYVIGLDGEWGSGKTTLLKKTYNLLKNQNLSNYYVVWFDAWKYEKYDPVLALYQHILEEIENKNHTIKSDLKKILLNTGILASDIVSRKFLGIEFDKIRDAYSNVLTESKTIHEKLEENIGKNGRLVVFIDDLDRCENENILTILANIKEVLDSKKTVFVLGIDMKKISVAWDIKHKGYEKAKLEGKEHVDKLFQLKLRIPPKSKEDLMKYIESLVKGFPDAEQEFIAKSVRENPRKIKLVLNTMYFLSKQMKMAKSSPGHLPYLLTITLLSVIHNDIFQILRRMPDAFFEAIHVCLMCLDYKELRANIESLEKMIEEKRSIDFHRGRINTTTTSKSGIELLSLIEKDEGTFSFILDTANYLKITLKNDKSGVDFDTKSFSNLIKETPFLS